MPLKRKKNEALPYLYSFTHYIEKRKVYLVDEVEYGRNELDSILSHLAIDVNYLIQDLNFIVPRNIPYISLVGTREMDDHIRVLLRSCTEDARQAAFLVLENTPLNITHLLDMRIIAAPPRLKVNEFAKTTAKITVDSTLTHASLSDIFLDISMFNSYSFLADLSQKEKQDFNSLKVDFAKKRKLGSYLKVDYTENIGYFSFALSCRNDNQAFDIKQYIEIWDDFISTNYKGYKHVEPSIADQIKRRVDPNHIPNGFEHEFDSRPSGIYFILRLNSHDVSKGHKRFILSRFGVKTISVGPLIIVDAAEMTTKQTTDILNRCCESRDLAAFKIVKQ